MRPAGAVFGPLFAFHNEHPGRLRTTVAPTSVGWALFKRCECPHLCRFCAGSVQVFGRRRDVLSTHSCGRRPKSAKARNRGGWGTRRGSERYGDLVGSCVPVRFDGSGPDDRFRSKNCGIDFERAPCALRERIWGGAAGRCGATMQAGALAGESEPEWRWSMRWRIDGVGIMRCRS